MFLSLEKNPGHRELIPWSQPQQYVVYTHTQLQQPSVRGRTDGTLPCQRPWEQQDL